MEFTTILDFWFTKLSPQQWYLKDKSLDTRIKERFLGVHRRAEAGELFAWRHSTQGRLAEIIILDQFSRNIFRNTPQAFACDNLALVLAQEAVTRKLLSGLSAPYKQHFLMPFMHSESKVIHSVALALWAEFGLDPKYEIMHKRIIDRFGRYPHRNQILGRESTVEEIAFLNEPESSF